MRRPARLPQAWFALFLLALALMAGLLPVAGLPRSLRLIGAGIALSGLGLMAAGVWALRRAGTPVMPDAEPARLVTSGIFRLSRNPIYLGNALILFGLSLALDQPGGVALVAGFMWLITALFILAEEARLSAAFGEAFTRYAAAVRRWI